MKCSSTCSVNGQQAISPSVWRNFIGAGLSAINPRVPAWQVVVGFVLAGCNNLGLFLCGIIVVNKKLC